MASSFCNATPSCVCYQGVILDFSKLLLETKIKRIFEKKLLFLPALKIVPMSKIYECIHNFF